jgi:hypothetical protein
MICIHWLNIKGVLLIKRLKSRRVCIFKMTIITNEPTIVLVNNEFLIFMHYQVDVKDIKCPLQ